MGEEESNKVTVMIKRRRIKWMGVVEEKGEWIVGFFGGLKMK